MSGCHPPKFKSAFPSLQELIDDLNERLNSLGHSQAEILSKHWDKLSESECRIERLEEKISEKYAHPNVIGRIERLENSPFGKSQTYAPLFEKLDRLEQSREAQSRSNKDLFERLAKLESQMEKVYQVFGKVIDSGQSMMLQKPKPERRPFKCPVCDGETIVLKASAKVAFDEMVRADLDTHQICNACEGKGIVWG